MADMDKITAILELLGMKGPFPQQQGSELNTRLKEIVRSKAPTKNLLGSSDAEQTQWLSLAQSIWGLPSDVALKNLCLKLNITLKSKSYCDGNSLTLADASLFYSISNSQHYNSSILTECNEVTRWMDHVSNLCLGKPFVSGDVAPTVFPVSSKPKSAGPAGEKSETVATASNAPVEDKKSKTAVESGKTEKKKKEKAAVEAPPAAAAPELDPSKLSIVVGVVTKCWEHPDSDKLYCEVCIILLYICTMCVCLYALCNAGN